MMFESRRIYEHYDKNYITIQYKDLKFSKK